MNKLFNAALLGPVLALGMGTGAVSAQETKTLDITFVVAADIYEMAIDETRGGFSRAAQVVRDERSSGRNVVYVWPGDAISPSLLSGFDKGEHVIELMNMEAPDIFVPGNHEFDFGKDVFFQRMADLNSTKLAANLRNADGSQVVGFSDTMMQDYDGIKIGYVGLTEENSATKSSPGDLVFSSSMDALIANAVALREAGADLVVAITHSGAQLDRAMLASGAVDIVLSGDDHDLSVFYDGNVALAEPSSDAANLVAMDVSISVTDDGNRRRVKWYPTFRIIDTAGVAVPDDYAAKVGALQADLSSELDVTLGMVTTALDTRKTMVRTQETAFGDLVTDAMKAAVNADIAITNGGGIRANREYDPNYEITRRDILTELPFGNVTILIEVSGADVLAALENGLKSAPEATGRFPQVSGLEVVYDPEQEPGSRVVSVKANGVDLDPDATYRLATNDYMGRGGDGYSMFKDSPRIIGDSAAKLMANAVMAYIRSQGTVSPTVEGRITHGM